MSHAPAQVARRGLANYRCAVSTNPDDPRNGAASPRGGDDGDGALLASARAGDRGAVEALLTRHERQIYRFGLRMCGNEEDAREVLQETLLAAFRGLGAFRGEAALSTWLYQIARSYCIKQRRRDEPAHAVLEEAQRVEASAPPPDASAHAREIGEALAAAVQALPHEQREALVLRDVEGLDAEEAARVVGIGVRALKSRLHRARTALRSTMAVLLDEAAHPGRPGGGERREYCPELARELGTSTASEIDQATCVRIEAHLAECPRCAGASRAAPSRLRQAVSLCGQIPGDEVPARVQAAVRAALRHALNRR